MMTATHTPTPWHSDSGIVHAAFNPRNELRRYVDIAVCNRIGNLEDEHKHNAAHIVRCVNAHDKLVAVLHDLVSDYFDDGDGHVKAERIRRASALLAEVDKA